MTLSLKQLSAVAGIIIASAYAIIATSPFWPLVIALAALSGFNLAHASRKDHA